MKPRAQASSTMTASRAVVTSLQRGSVSRALWYRLTRPATSNADTVATTRLPSPSSWTTTSSTAAPPAAAGDEAIERRKELGTGSPLSLMELAQDVEAGEDGGAPERPMTHSFGFQAVGGLAQIPTELLGQGRPECLCAVGQRRVGGRGHRFTAHAARQGLDQASPGSDAPEVQEAARATEPVPEEADHRGLVAGGGQEVEMVRAQRAVPHDTDARQAMALLQGEAAEELFAVDDQQEVAVGATGPGQPPRTQEGRRNGRGIDQLIPLRRPPVEARDVNQAGWRHYRASRGMLTIGESGHLTTTIVPLPADTWSRSLCWLLATVAGIESGPP